MPDAIEMIFLRVAQIFDLQSREDLFQRHPVKHIELCPRQLASLNPVQGRAIDCPPRIGERRPVDGQSFCLAELLAFVNHARAPINDCAENVEGEYFDRSRRRVNHWVLQINDRFYYVSERTNTCVQVFMSSRAAPLGEMQTASRLSLAMKRTC